MQSFQKIVFLKKFIFYAIKCPLAALYAYVLSLTKNKYDTEDVLQETYVSIAENASSYRGGNKSMMITLC